MSQAQIVLKEGQVEDWFRESRNIWNVVASSLFFCPERSLVFICKEKQIDIKIVDDSQFQFIRRHELGGYNWNLVNMHLSHDEKMSACALLFSRCCEIKDVGCYYEKSAPVISKEEKDRIWRESMRISAERELKEEEERREKIKSGEIILPEKNRPYELWIKEGDSLKRIKTYRSQEALNKALDFNIKEGQEYATSCCAGDNELYREWFYKGE